MGLLFFTYLVIIQIFTSECSPLRGLKTPYVYQIPRARLDDGPCRFHFLSPDCLAWMRDKSDPYSKFQDGSQTSSFSARGHEMASMLPMMIQSFEALCLKEPKSSICPKRTSKVYGPFYFNSKRSRALEFNPNSSDDSKTSSNLHSNHKVNMNDGTSVNRSKVVMAILSKSKPTPSTESYPSKYDICSHPFHSWQCRGRSRSRTQIIPEKIESVAKPPPRKEVNFVSKIPKLPLSQSTNNQYNKCSHPFHSWLCNTPTSNSSIKDKVFSNPKQPKIISTTIRPSVSVKSGDPCNHPFHSWNCRKHKKTPKVSIHIPTASPPVHERKPLNNTYMNPCNHSFHSWLCKSFTVPKRKKAYEVSTTTRSVYNIPKSRASPFISFSTSTEKPILGKQPKKGSTSFIDILPPPPKTPYKKDDDPCTHSFHSWRCKVGKQIQLRKTVTTTPSTTHANYVTPIQYPTTTAAPPKKSWDGANPCSHAFHSWLCQPLRPNLKFKSGYTPQYPKRGKNFIKKEYSSPPTTESPQPAEPTSGFLNNNVRTSQPIRSTTPRPQTSTTKKYKKFTDSCSHSFHSWLCEKLQKTTSIVPSYEIPNIRSLPLENEVPIPVRASLSFASRKHNEEDIVSSTTHRKPLIRRGRQQSHATSFVIPDSQTIDNKPSTVQPIRYKTISFSVPTDPFFTNIPNIGLLPLEEPINSVKSPTINEPQGMESRIRVHAIRPPNHSEVETSDSELEDINYYLNFESHRL